MRFEDARNYLLNKLENEIPANLNYHNIQHTRDVLSATEELAAMQKTFLMTTSSCSRQQLIYHDAGFLNADIGHEEESCKMAVSILPDFGYSQESIQEICRMIMATHLPQEPPDKKAKVLCDADLYYLGTSNYRENAENLFLEMMTAGIVKSRVEWTEKQIRFLEEHKYFTQSAIDKLSAGQHQNLVEVRAELKFAHSVTGHKNFYLSDLFLILIGVFIAGFALRGFLVPNKFFDGGMTGISLLIHEIYKFNLSYVIVLANLPFIVMGLFTINPHFAWKTLFCIIILGLCQYYIPYPTVTDDKLLVAIFRWFFPGCGHRIDHAGRMCC